MTSYPFLFKGLKNIYSITAKIVQAFISAKQNSKWLLAAVLHQVLSLPSGKVFEVWMVDGNYRASGYPLSSRQISRTGTLKYIESLVYSPTYIDLVVTLEAENDKDPGPYWSQAVAAYWLASPFGQ